MARKPNSVFLQQRPPPATIVIMAHDGQANKTTTPRAQRPEALGAAPSSPELLVEGDAAKVCCARIQRRDDVPFAVGARHQVAHDVQVVEGAGRLCGSAVDDVRVPAAGAGCKQAGTMRMRAV